MKKPSKLGKLKMPEDKKPDMAELDLSDSSDDSAPAEGSGEEEASESADEEAGEMDSPDDKSPSNPDLEKVSDEDLIAELKKRGLAKELDSAPEGSGHDDYAPSPSSES